MSGRGRPPVCPPARLPVCHTQEILSWHLASHNHLPPTPSLPESGRRTTGVRAQIAIQRDSRHWLFHTRTPYYLSILVLLFITPTPKVSATSAIGASWNVCFCARQSRWLLPDLSLAVSRLSPPSCFSCALSSDSDSMIFALTIIPA